MADEDRAEVLRKQIEELREESAALTNGRRLMTTTRNKPCADSTGCPVLPTL